MIETEVLEMGSFATLGITDNLIDILKKQGVIVPTPIQTQAIPEIFKGRDIIGKSQTGTGKTLAYLLPVLQRIHIEKTNVEVLILTPTRELSKQVFDVLKPFAEMQGIDAADVIGGRTIENQIQKLKRNPHVIIGTPGRLLDHVRRRTLDLSHVKFVILDEADQMLAAGFREDIETLIDETPKRRQLLLFSATMSEEAIRLGRKYMTNPYKIDVAEKETASTVEQRIYETTWEHKLPLLIRHIKEMQPFMSIVFCNTKEETQKLATRLAEEGDFIVAELHGDLSQGQRNQIIKRFEKMEIQVLVASDIAARGLDVDGVTHVFNFGIPNNIEYYVHRIGRTGRAGTTGISITYATPEDGNLLRKLEKSIHETITRYDEKGRIRRVRAGRTKKKVVTPGMYKPTKKKEHKALGHKGSDMRKKKKKETNSNIGRHKKR